MKLKNVHLPHPHPNGSLSDSLLGRRLVLLLPFAVLVVGLSDVSTPTVTGGRDRGKGSLNMYIHTHALKVMATLCCQSTGSFSTPSANKIFPVLLKNPSHDGASTALKCTLAIHT